MNHKSWKSINVEMIGQNKKTQSKQLNSLAEYKMFRHIVQASKDVKYNVFVHVIQAPEDAQYKVIRLIVQAPKDEKHKVIGHVIQAPEETIQTYSLNT